MRARRSARPDRIIFPVHLAYRSSEKAVRHGLAFLWWWAR